MNEPALELAFRHVSEPLARGRIEGTATLRIWGQSRDPEHPATWAVAIRLISRDGTEESGVLLSLTTGGPSDLLGTELQPLVLGPFTLTPVDAERGARIVVELGSLGPAHLETKDDGETWVQFSADLSFEDVSTALRDKRASRKIGTCIYCGESAKPLSREHIIPEGLNGELTLVAASCGACSDITSAIEKDMLRNAFGAMRVAFQLRSKRRKERPTHLPIRVRRNGEETEINIPRDEYPVILTFPIFPQAGHLVARSESSGIDIVGVAHVQIGGLPLPELHRKYGGDYVGVQMSYEPVKFARTLAKIAYGFAVLRLGLARVVDRWVLPALRGETSDIGHWVGCDGPASSPMPPSGGLHSLTPLMDKTEIHVLIRLFAQFGAPEYHVVVGRVLD